MKTVRNVVEIKIDRIKIINPRERDPAKFAENVASIQRLGLKRPIVVNSRFIKEHGKYELVCGQGRIEAFQKLKRDTIPALTVDVDRETALIMSIAENATRSMPPPIWFAQVVKGLVESGMSIDNIAVIVDRSPVVVRDYLTLIEHGDRRLINAVEQQRIAVRAAIAISREPNGELQQLLAKGIESGLFDANEISAVRKIIQNRMRFLQANQAKKESKNSGRLELSIEALRKEIKRKLDKWDDFIRRSRRNENQITILSDSCTRLFEDSDWLEVIEAQKLTEFPKLRGDDLSVLFPTMKK